MKMATRTSEHNVIIRMDMADACNRAELEDLAIAVLEVVEQHASHIADGPVISGEFDPPVIELDLVAQAASRSELLRQMAELLEIITEHSPVAAAMVGSSVAERDPHVPAPKSRGARQPIPA
jgi:hypothetical protein